MLIRLALHSVIRNPHPTTPGFKPLDRDVGPQLLRRVDPRAPPPLPPGVPALLAAPAEKCGCSSDRAVRAKRSSRRSASFRTSGSYWLPPTPTASLPTIRPTALAIVAALAVAPDELALAR